MGATASTVQGYNEVRSSRKRGETFIPLFDINEHIRMFQHQTGGDILMLVDKDAVEFLKDSTAGEYQEIFISRRGTEYLDNLSLALSFEATKALQDKVAGRANFTKLQPRVPVGDEVVDEEEEEVEREPTLYQTHLEDNISAYYGSGAKPVVKTSTQVASPKVVKKTASVEGHKNTERDREEPGTPLRSTGSSLGGSASSTSFAHRTELRGVLTFESRSMSMDLENDVVPPLLALGSLSRSVDNNGPVSNVSSLSMSMSYDRESEVTRGSVPTIHTSSTAAANFRKHEQEQLAKLARSNSSATGAAVAPAEDRNAAPKSARSSPSQSQAKADLPPLQSPAQAMATPSPRRSPRGIAAAVTPVSSITSVLTGGGATPGSLTAGTSVAPISGLTSRADSKDFKDSPPSPASPPEATPGPAPTTTPTTASALTATTAPVAAVTTTAPIPVPVSVKMREFVPTAYLPPGQRHRQRIAAEDEADIRKSIIEGSRILSAGSKDELNNISNMTMTYSSMGRGNSSDSKRHQDNKHSDSSEGGVKLSPRAMSFLSATADSKAPSLRAHLNSNSSSSTIHTGLAPHHNGGGSFHQGIADAGPITMGLGCSSSSTRVPGGGGNTSLCPNCGQELRSGNARDSERFDSHVSSCSMRKEMRSVLANIDQVLEPKLEELAEFNRKQLNTALSTVIGKAADEFDQTSLAHAAVKRVVTSVLRVTYDTSAKKIDRVEQALSSLVEKFSQEHIDVMALSQQGNAEAQRRASCLSNLLRILTQTADKLALKRQNIAAYKKYMLGVQDLCILRKLGKGSFATVYLARLVDTKQMYAVKVLSKHVVTTAHLYHQVMMERTALVMASRYPKYFVTLQYAFQNKDDLFFVMEYMQGGDCLSLLSSMKRLPEHVAQHFIAQVSLAVKHLHAHGVIHRDIKPDNVMITSRGHAKLGDFGSVFPIHPEYRQMGPQQQPVAFRKPGGGENSTQVHSVNGSHTPSSANSRSVRGGGQGALVNQFAHEISTVAASAFRNSLLVSGAKGSSSSLSLWLDEESDGPLSAADGFQSSSNNWSSNSTSSLFFNKGAGGPMMQNTFDIVGNYFYASPEMAGGTCIFNQSVDWWAVGVMLFHMLTGTTPFEGLTKASTLENIERMQGDWDVLPEEVTPGCKDFLLAILTHSFETRLGSESSDEILGHPFFANIHFPTLYDGLGPYYPRPPSADESSPDFYCFSAIGEEESLEVPRFSPRGREDKHHSDSYMADDFPLSRSCDNCDSSASASKAQPLDEDLYQDFDFHPFH